MVMHLPEGWTKILLVRTYGLGLADGGIYWDIPTEKIPIDLRRIGSVFLVETNLTLPPPKDPAERYQTRFEDFTISPLTPDEARKYSGSE